MVVIITGASHTGKTLLAQKFLEVYNYPYVSQDLVKMGLIRSGNTRLTPLDDKELKKYLWPIFREMIKTALENEQNLTVEGVYIPYDWKKDFTESELARIRFVCLIMSESYIRNHFEDIQFYANAIETRLDDRECTLQNVLRDNLKFLKGCRKYHLPYTLIDTQYDLKPEL